ncbi:MAG: glycosyl hydrolase [Bryobacteraceae bacterium]
MLKTAWKILFIAAISSLAYAQQPWQHLQMPTAAQVKKIWKNPPAAYGPDVYYGFNGHMTEAVMNRDLDTLKRLGFQAITVQAGRNMPFPYLSKGYFQLFRKFVEAAKKRGIKVWIVDDAGYPSGFAGGKFTKLRPDLRMQALELTPRGVKHEFRTSPTRSATNPKGGKNADQSLEDYMNPAATRQFLAWTHEQYKRYMGDEFGKTIMGFRGDEPDYSIRGLPWTDAFFRRFEQIKGYDVQPYLAGFFAPKLTDEEKRVKADYWDVFSRMFAAGFFRVQGEWCAANHVEYQVHLNHEERQMELAHSEGGFFRDMRYVQVPGIDAIWHQIWTDTISDYPRLASSEAHVYGKPRAFTESFAAYHPRPDVRQARYILNEQFVRGINLVEIMYFPSTSAGPRPLRGFMSEPGFPELMHYVQRVSYLMSMGRPTASVALYLPTSSFWLGDAAANRDFVSTERLLSEQQIDFDIVDADALAKDLILDNGAFRTRSGNRYRTVILPGETLLSQAVLNRLRKFTRGGGRVLFLGYLPTLIAGRSIRNARPATPSDFSWASVEVSAQLSPTPTPGFSSPREPPAPQVVPAAILRALNRAVPLRGITLNKPDTVLRYTKRRLKDASVYFFFNESGQPFHRTVGLAGKGTKTEVWNPQTGSVQAFPSTRAKGSLKIQLALKPYETRMIVVSGSGQL